MLLHGQGADIKTCLILLEGLVRVSGGFCCKLIFGTLDISFNRGWILVVLAGAKFMLRLVFGVNGGASLAIEEL